MRHVILYLPVIHRGYLEFFDKVNPDMVWVLSQEVLADFPFLGRDFRALSPEQAVKMLIALNRPFKVVLADRQLLNQADAITGSIVMPEEDIAKTVAERYFSNRTIEWHSIFLRWNKWNVSAKNKINPDHAVSREAIHREHIARTGRWAKKSPDWWRQVGVEVVKDDQIIYSTYNKHLPSERTVYIDGDPRSNFNAGERIDLSCALHGERDAIAYAARYGLALEGSDIYVTTFPCPSCARVIAVAGIRRVFYAEGYSLLDAEEVLKVFGVEIIRVEL